MRASEGYERQFGQLGLSQGWQGQQVNVTRTQNYISRPGSKKKLGYNGYVML